MEDEKPFMDHMMDEMIEKYKVKSSIIYKLWHWLLAEEFDSDGIVNDYENKNNDDIDDDESQIKQILKKLIDGDNKKKDLFYINNILINYSHGFINFPSIYQESVRFFYWHHYKNNNNSHNVLWKASNGKNKIESNVGYTLKEWYIGARFSSFKEEILSCLSHVSLYNFSMKDWNDTKTKSKLKYNAYKDNQDARKLACRCLYNDDGQEFLNPIDYETFYGIPKNKPITIAHIMSLLFYTNYTHQSYEFSASFRKRFYHESDKSLKYRHSWFAQWAKLLRETVECFGMQMYDSPTPIFYHGISKQLIFASTSFKINGPLSTTAGLFIKYILCFLFVYIFKFCI